MVTTRDNRTPAVIEADLLEAKRELLRRHDAFDRYSGNNPNKFQGDIQRASVAIRRLEAELRRAMAG
jgi:hypothetical protein